MSALAVRLFGKFDVHRDGRPVADLEACRVQELFSYLLLHRDRPHPRTALAGLLWGDRPGAQHMKYLRQALWQLQTALEASADLESPRVVLVETEWVRLNAQTDLWLDVAEFEQVSHQVLDVRGQQLDQPGAVALQAAVELYRGDLLEGWYQDWCLYERERFRNVHLAMLDKLMGYSEAHHEYEAGLAYGARILRYDRARERTHRRMMRLHFLAGDRTAALRQFESCVSALREELDVRPDRRTLALHEQIRAGQLAAPIQASASTDAALRVTPAPLPEILGYLKRVRGVLADLDRQIEQQIETVELTLDKISTVSPSLAGPLAGQRPGRHPDGRPADAPADAGLPSLIET